ncbi:hypothetical protein BGY98DRAFT_983433, partial [Russula aff. rugulosa BPL654]
MASCAVLRTIGSKKLPPEARRIRMSPVGVVNIDVAADPATRPCMALRRCSNAL